LTQTRDDLDDLELAQALDSLGVLDRLVLFFPRGNLNQVDFVANLGGEVRVEAIPRRHVHRETPSARCGFVDSAALILIDQLCQDLVTLVGGLRQRSLFTSVTP